MANTAAVPASALFPVQHTGPLTALQIVDKIIAQSGAPGRPRTVDRITAGDPTTAVTGIAVAAMATFDCLKAASAAGCNLIVSYEPAWWAEDDGLDRMEGDALFLAKRDFIRAHSLVVFNFHDHWRDRTPDGLAAGMARALGWESYLVDRTQAAAFRLPATTLLGLAKELHAKLGDRTMRMVGDPQLPVRMVAAGWGNLDQMSAIRLLRGPADVVVCGYTHEWEAVEYAQDMIATGAKKGLILLGDVKSIEAGMPYCADWLKTFITDIPVVFLPVGEPYWNPDDLSG